MITAYIVCGRPASGKTTYGKKLAKEKNAVFLDIDLTTERLIRIALAEAGHDRNDRDSKYFKSTYREPIYQTMFDIARENLKRLNAVIVGPFTKEVRNKLWLGILKEDLKCDVEVHYVYCNSEVRYNRMLKRKSDRDSAKLKNWEKINSYYGDEGRPVFDHIYIDTSRNFTKLKTK